MNLEKLHSGNISHNKWFFNSLLWLFFFGILLMMFSSFPPKKIDIIYTLSYGISLVFPVTITLYCLIPKFLKKENYIGFVLLLSLTILGFSFINITFHQQLIDLVFPNYFFISYHSNYQTVLVFILFTLTALFIKLTEDWIYFNHNEKIQTEAKLNILKGQINPHFLFNSLNVLYSLSMTKKEETTTAILQLSDILRYVIYNIDSDKITIQQEINLINSYINFEKNRHIKNSTISFENSFENNVKIYPMLLLPIIENAFKHGLKSGIKNPFVNIMLHVKNNDLNFIVKNNFISINQKEIDEYSGIGLKNVQQNLTIVYPKKHVFLIEKKEDVFTVKLQIQL